jgi:ribosomal protein S18 acetylase RimI-like enzyme
MLQEISNYGFYSIYHAQRADIPDIHGIDGVSFISTVSTEWVEQRREHFRDRFFVAKKHNDGKIIGFLTGANENYYPGHLPGYTYISRFAVSVGHRRCGVGTALLTTLYDALIQHNDVRGVVADVRESNTPSLNFFLTKHAFSIHQGASAPGWYERGNTLEDRHKIVCYKTFI